MRKDQCLASSVGPRVKPEDCARMLRIQACFVSLSFAGLVVLARSLNPIPSRTRPLNSSAPMVLWLKPWESRSLPGLPRTKQFLFTCHDQTERRFPFGRAAFLFLAFCFWRNVFGVGRPKRFPPDGPRLCRVHGPFISTDLLIPPRKPKSVSTARGAPHA